MIGEFYFGFLKLIVGISVEDQYREVKLKRKDGTHDFFLDSSVYYSVLFFALRILYDFL